MEEIEYKIWFSKLNITNRKKLELLKKFKTCRNIYLMKKNDFFDNNYDNELILRILNKELRYGLEKEANFMVKNSIRLFNIYDKKYPKKLLNIDDCPVQIFVRGNEEILDKQNIAIIGSRRASDYGKKVAKQISEEISKYGINVVSGLAVGIDKYAHLGALNNGNGRTIAVLGNGLKKTSLYPIENLKIFERIIEEGGCLVSEYSCFEKAKSYYFPARNRIISGLSDKIIVVEAGEKSGSLITVDFALEQGKDVYAVPGEINKIYSKGTNKLIQDGAIPFLNVKDLNN